MDSDLWVMGWLGPSEVMGAFGCPLEDFAFDDAWVGADASRGVEASDEFLDGAMPEGGDGVTVVRGKNRCATTTFE